MTKRFSALSFTSARTSLTAAFSSPFDAAIGRSTANCLPSTYLDRVDPTIDRRLDDRRYQTAQDRIDVVEVDRFDVYDAINRLCVLVETAIADSIAPSPKTANNRPEL